MDVLVRRSGPREHVPTRWGSLAFVGKAWGLRTQRWWRDRSAPMVRWPQGPEQDPAWQVPFELRSALWLDRNGPERTFEIGKVENLRLACSFLSGVVIDAGGVFSFWRQVGRASRRRGFVIGRMLQQGCVIPAVGGGLCQLSNALYEVALRYGCEIVERHAHSVRLPNAAIHDATVAWNYVDLRFRVKQRTRVMVRMTAEELIVGLGVERAVLPFPLLDLSAASPQEEPALAVVQSCLTCNETGCFRHMPRQRDDPEF